MYLILKDNIMDMNVMELNIYFWHRAQSVFLNIACLKLLS